MRNVGRFGISLQRSVIPAGLLCFQGFVVGCSEAETRDPDAKGPTKMTETASVEGREEGVWQPQRAISRRHRGLERRRTWRMSNFLQSIAKRQRILNASPDFRLPAHSTSLCPISRCFPPNNQAMAQRCWFFPAEDSPSSRSIWKVVKFATG